MKNTVKIAIVAAIAAVGLAACTNAPEPEQSAARLPQTQSSTPAPPVVTEVVTETVTNPPKPQAVTGKVGKVDNRIGYGPFKLGMTLDEARAAGLTKLTWEHDNGDGHCVSDGKVTFSKVYGLVMVELPADARTSKGIGLGSTYADVKRAYPDAKDYRGGYTARIDETSIYAFKGDDPATDPGNDALVVEEIAINSTEFDCALAYL